MAHKMIDIWCCDRCGITRDQPFKNDPKVAVEVHYFGYTDPDVLWKDLCGACHNQVTDVIRGLVIG